jgi:hypothetical protein
MPFRIRWNTALLANTLNPDPFKPASVIGAGLFFGRSILMLVFIKRINLAGFLIF